ncbi:MAG: hypothetical protein L6R40_002927 [Gallowayella cf. fulva]|nr:MAG: hypothetical protein L6R40_002927 [Xanthomendoza cf. fulva]
MPGPGLHEEAFLSLVKRLQKGKGKETNVSTNFRSWSPKNEYRSPREIPPVQPEAVEATSLHERPATVGAQDESQMDQEETFSGVFEEVQQQAIYTVIGSNFAPGTTADDIELALFPVSGKMEGCRITTYLPSVTAEMVFTHEARAENVIATFNNRKSQADGHRLRMFWKPDDTPAPLESTNPVNSVHSISRPQLLANFADGHQAATSRPPDLGPGDDGGSVPNMTQPRNRNNAAPPTAPKLITHEELKQADRPLEQNYDGEALFFPSGQIEERPGSPTTRGRGGNRYASVIGAIDVPNKIEAWTPIEIVEEVDLDNDTRKSKAETEKQAWKDRVEFEELIFLEAEMERKEREAEEQERKKKKKAEEAEFARLDAEIEQIERAIAQFYHQPAVITPSTFETGNDTASKPSATVQLISTSRLTPPTPLTPMTTHQKSPVLNSSIPLLSNGQEFLKALTRSSPLSTPIAATDTGPEQPSLPEDILPDELPTSTKTLPNLFDEQTRPLSPLTQITSTGTLPTPSGEHTINLAPPSAPPTQHDSDRTSSDTSLSKRPKIAFRIPRQPGSHHRPSPNPPIQTQNPPIYDHNRPPPDHSNLSSRPSNNIINHPSSPATATTSQTLTLLSGSGPKGYRYIARRYDRANLVKIGKAYQQRVLLALMEREGRGKLVLGVVEPRLMN